MHLQGSRVGQDERGAQRQQPCARGRELVSAVLAHDRQAAQAQRAAQLQQRLADHAVGCVEDDGIACLQHPALLGQLSKSSGFAQRLRAMLRGTARHFRRSMLPSCSSAWPITLLLR